MHLFCSVKSQRVQARVVQSYPQRAGVGAGFHSNRDWVPHKHTIVFYFTLMNSKRSIYPGKINIKMRQEYWEAHYNCEISRSFELIPESPNLSIIPGSHVDWLICCF